jgi:hypothetical protein
MGSNAPCPVGAMSATNRTVVPITVMVRVWLANSHSPVGTDASSPIDSIDTGGCMTWLGEHERAKSHHDGKHRCATSIEGQYSAFHFIPFGCEECDIIPNRAKNQPADQRRTAAARPSRSIGLLAAMQSGNLARRGNTAVMDRTSIKW